MKQFTFSIVIPTYQRHERLKRAVKSILNQQYKNYEIIIVNDDQNDKEIFTLFDKANISSITIINNSRTKGGNGARNTGIIAASGKYIALLDDDDEWKENHLSELFKVTENRNAKCVIASHEVENENTWIKHEFTHHEFSLSEFLLGNIQIGASSTICFEKELCDKIGLFDEELQRHQDLDLILRFLVQNKIYTTRSSSVKIYGHNIVNYKKIRDSKKLFLNKAQNLIQDKKLFRIYKAYHYRNLMINALFCKHYSDALKLMCLLPFLGILNPIRYIRVPLILIDNIFNSKIDSIWQSYKNKISPKF